MIKKITYKPFHAKLKKSFHSTTIDILERSGFYLCLKDSLGISGIGEVSPLPNFSEESLLDAKKEIEKLISFLNVNSIDETIIPNFGLPQNFFSVPSVKFGFEQAVISILFQNQLLTLQNSLTLQSNEIIFVNSLISLVDKETFIQELRRQVELGFTTIKIKLGRKNFNDDFDILKASREWTPENIKIRLDANRAWDYETAVNNINLLLEFNVEFIEEPCKSLEETRKLSKISKIPIALDESITNLTQLNAEISNGDFVFFVIKPMIYGSIIEMMNFLKVAEERNVNIIFSSSFETAIGRSAIIFLASLVKHKYSHGLGTAEYFENEALVEKYPIRNGKIHFSINDFVSEQKINYEHHFE